MCLRLLVVQVYAKLRHVGAHHKNTTLASDGGTTEADGRGESRRPRQLAIRPSARRRSLNGRRSTRVRGRWFDVPTTASSTPTDPERTRAPTKKNKGCLLPVSFKNRLRCSIVAQFTGLFKRIWSKVAVKHWIVIA